MHIHIVQQGETVQTIADLYGISVENLIRDNELKNQVNLVIGQCLIIAIPEQIHTVQELDTLQGIADLYDITVMQLYRNNPFLVERESLYVGETIVISYANNEGQLTVHSNAYPFINDTILRKTLPYLTYLSIINYTATTEGEIKSYYDDSTVIQMAKSYDVMPLMLLTTFTLQGEANVKVTYELLLNENYQKKQIDNIIIILKEKGYYGINISLQYVNATTISYYEKYLTKVFTQLSEEGYYLFVTLAPGISYVDSEIFIENIEFTFINQIASDIIFMNFEWASNLNAPSPIISIRGIKAFLDTVVDTVPVNKSILGISTIGYDWQLPYVAGISSVRSLTTNNAITLAYNVEESIRFDEPSQTPYFTYAINVENNSIQHVVWFIDARTINSLLNLIIQYKLNGVDIWNMMNYDAQLWLVVNTQYEINKIQ